MDEAGGVDGECFQAVKETSNNVCFIMNVGWSIYPLGYFEDSKQITDKPKWAPHSKRNQGLLQSRMPRYRRHKCFPTKPGQTRCLKNCTPNMNHSRTHPQGTTDILKHKHSERLSISQCDYSDVFSDVSFDVESGIMMTVVTYVESDWHFVKRKLSGTRVNNDLFNQIRRMITEGAKRARAAS